MLKIRVVKTASCATSVQAVRYENNKRIIVKHFGSYHTTEELNAAKMMAQEWINKVSSQLSMFQEKSDTLLDHIDQYTFLGVYYGFFYECIDFLQIKLGFSSCTDKFLGDLVKIRLFEPASKLRSIELLEQYFGIKYQRKHYYKIAPNWLPLKEAIALKVLEFTKLHHGFNFDLVFYDVTTLYFETFEEDTLRKNGFSKDNKSQQPQILIALMVNKEGFPIDYEIYAGNTFEGHTIIPTIHNFITTYKVNQFTVVADAAMISSTNIEELVRREINYIVGARLGNITNELLNEIDQKISREDGKSIRLKTDTGFLICSYSTLRYRKDVYEMNKQIEKAKAVIKEPSKSKRVKFTQSKDLKVELNEPLITKTTKLLGIKGYYTNVEESILANEQVIQKYHELHKIEHAFRISKNDLQTRPIFHYKEDPIKLHILICFMALAISKHIELETKSSIKKFVHECKRITDAQMSNKWTKKVKSIRANETALIKEYIKLLGLPH
jgi:transposase